MNSENIGLIQPPEKKGRGRFKLVSVDKYKLPEWIETYQQLDEYIARIKEEFIKQQYYKAHPRAKKE